MMRRPLPAYPALEALPALREALAVRGAAVMTAPPGSGKTTVVPLALLDEPWLAGKRILLLEPRRVAARAAARRMAELLGEEVGRTVGYQVRFERRVSTSTRIEVLTEGLLTRRLQAEPDLPGVGAIIFDEFHERSLDADLALALALDARDALNPELRLLVMSATLDAAAVARLLDDAPLVSAAGRLFPVDIVHRAPRAGETPEQALPGCVQQLLAAHAGDVLAFLPGAREIRQAQQQLELTLGPAVAVMPLYGELPAELQDAALAPAPGGRRKVILATNIAQTSLTVEGVSSVIDSGLVRVARYDLGSGANRLQTERVSRASADQRAGRAGRLGPGRCVRLWSREQQVALAEHDSPAIASADLARLALELAAWGVRDPGQLRWMDPPPQPAWRAAIDLLDGLGAVDAQGRITAHGRALLRLPLDPRRAELMVSAAASGLSELAAWCIAVLDERDAGGADLALRVEAAMAGRGDRDALRRMRDNVGQLSRLAAGLEQAVADASPRQGPALESALARLVARAWPERIARSRAVGEGLLLAADGREVAVSRHDALAHSAFLAIAHWDPGPPRRVRSACRISEAELRQALADRLQWQPQVFWDAQAQAVVAEQRQALGALVLASRPLRDQPQAVRAALLDGIRQLGLGALPWTDAARSLQARIESLRHWRAGEAWPACSDDALLAALDDWLGPQLDGLSRRDHLSRLDVHTALQRRLDHQQLARLDRLAPTHLGVPSGSRIVLDYAADGSAPVLAVKLQELFGQTRTPAVDEGRMPVKLHLLSPARRPIQVTSDLAGFWARTYAEVRKELKGRYPRHPWPDDPLQAPATARAKPRGS